ncbi:MAG TPA: hypothetical protein PKA64_25165 [Myxococcota bacterium]|nr:hypothetical protein [Myxococcota bacterium]
MRVEVLLVTLGMAVGCSGPPDGLPAANVPLPQTMVLSGPSTLYPGDTVTLSVSGASPGASLTLVASDGEIGAGVCPPAWGGQCADITRGSGYLTLGTLRAGPTGSASVSRTLPARANAGSWVFQAVNLADHTGTNPIAVHVLCDAGDNPAAAPTVFDCTGQSACQGQTITCPDGHDCQVECGGVSACQVATIQCPTGGRCDISCSNTSACQVMTVIGGSGELALDCSGVSSCQIATVTCGDAACLTTCDASQGASVGAIDDARSCVAVDEGCL